MTQPQTVEDQNNPYLVLGTAATALALIAIESRIRSDIDDAISAEIYALTSAVRSQLAVAAQAGLLTGIAFISAAYFHGVSTRIHDQTRKKVAAAIESGYTSAAAVAQQKATRDLADDRYQVPATLPELGDNLSRFLADIDLMFGHTYTDLQNNIVNAYDIHADPIEKHLDQAIDTVGRRLENRAQATAGVAVHTGAYDAQHAIYQDYQLHTGRTGLMKRWIVTSLTPCGMCAALDGTVVGLAGEFDATATTNDRDLRPVWRNNQGPPRHPNCRCTIELVQT